MAKPIVYGPAYSTYVRSTRLTLEEKGVDYDLREFNFLEGMPEEHYARHPFGKVPAFEHDGLSLYETAAIERYIDESFDGPPLQPADPTGRARMTQVISILDAYTYAPLIGTIVIQRLIVPMQGGTTDEAKVKDAVPAVERVLGVLDGFIDGRDYVVGSSLSLADLHLAPLIFYLGLTPEGKTLLGKSANVTRWWGSISRRESVRKTEPKFD